MKSSLVLCVLLGVVLMFRAATVASPFTTSVTTDAVTGYYSDPTQTTVSTTPYPTADPPFTSPDCCFTTTTLTRNPPTYTAPTLSQNMCPDGWWLFQGRCYYFVNEGMTWPQAQSNCALLESMLVSIHSVQEYSFAQQFTLHYGNQEAWLGGFYLQDEWLWIDGSWFYNNSRSIESPDSTNPCLLLNTYEAWSNSPCNADGFASICVKNSNVSTVMVCPEGWKGFQGRCYYYNSESLTWPQADTYCASLEASLVSVHSPQEYFFLYKQTFVDGSNTAWLGGFFLEDQWMWQDGSWFYQGFFSQMSPDSTNPCLSTYASEGWTNYDCEQTFPSFCVKN